VVLVVDKVVRKAEAVRLGTGRSRKAIVFVQFHKFHKLGYETADSDDGEDVPLLLHRPRHLHSSFVLI
jgi:hypothetical protein